jgi:hypothetical protein
MEASGLAYTMICTQNPEVRLLGIDTGGMLQCIKFLCLGKPPNTVTQAIALASVHRLSAAFWPLNSI